MMFDAKTSGKRMVKPRVITVVGVRIRSPSTRKIQPIPKPTAKRSRNPATTPATPASGR